MFSKPLPNEIEISSFGNNFGECIVIHPGQGEWLIVDSFKNPNTKEPVALDYLRNLGVKYSENVKVIVATHWHDDHINGLEEVVTQCQSAQFVCSDAIQKDDFMAFLYADEDLPDGRPGNKELNKILKILKNRNAFVMRASENKIVHTTAQYQVYSLSPSDQAITLAQKEIAKLLPKEACPRLGIRHLRPNYTGVVLLIVVGDQGILLGADLEDCGDVQLGWTRIVRSSARPNVKSGAFKIPHHGSETAHCAEVWEKLLNPKPYSIVTPFVLGDVFLPQNKDIRRIISYTPNLWLASNPREKKSPRRRENMVERTIKTTVKKIRSLSSMGHVRMRFLPNAQNAQWKVEMFGSAAALSNQQ
jgi:beta-lactamase superfamily II metal-dependent hydrolase